MNDTGLEVFGAVVGCIGCVVGFEVFKEMVLPWLRDKLRPIPPYDQDREVAAISDMIERAYRARIEGSYVGQHRDSWTLGTSEVVCLGKFGPGVSYKIERIVP